MELPDYIKNFINENKGSIKKIYEMNHLDKDDFDILNFVFEDNKVDVQYIDNKNIDKVLKEDILNELKSKLPNSNTIIIVAHDKKDNNFYHIFFNLE